VPIGVVAQGRDGVIVTLRRPGTRSRSLAGDGVKAQPALAVGTLGIGPHRLVEGLGVVADEDPPLPGAHTVDG
jgi:hypothetical protein